MHSVSLLVLTVFTVLVILQMGRVEGQTCKEIVSSLTKRQMAGMGNCAKKMTFKNKKDKSLKGNCILKCVMATEGILSEDGLMSKETFESFLVKEKFPPAMKQRAIDTMGACRDKHADSLDTKEEFCKSYDSLIKCLMTAFLGLCP